MWVESPALPRHAAPDGAWLAWEGLAINMALLTELRWGVLAAGGWYRVGFMASPV
jgi:hypothetical protein